MSHTYFITGTDTDIGKTYVSVMLLRQFSGMNKSTLGMKPISSGGFMQDGCIKNYDAILLQKHSTLNIPYSQINPFSFIKPVAPSLLHALKVKNVASKIQNLLKYKADLTIIEGAGGICMPLNNNETIADLIKHCDIEIILVVGIKLGCLNQAILTYNMIQHMKLKVKGWIANCIDPSMLMMNENIKFLTQYISFPLLSVVEHNKAAKIVL